MAAMESMDECVCSALRKAARAVGRIYDAALAPAGMTTAQFAILRGVACSGPVPLSRLAEQQAMDRTSLYRAIAPIEARGWLCVEAGRGRAKRAVLTEAGRAALAAAEPRWEGIQMEMASGIGVEWRVLEERLAAMIERVRGI
jgi:DNA-binding MarR family transcriptional regulator